jgi:hypothetical protein
MSSFFSSYWADFLARFDGPLHFRLYFQPLMATFLAARAGRQDVLEGRGAYLWSLITDPGQRRYLIQSGWQGIMRIFALALVLDAVYQFIVWHGLKPLQMLLTATVLAVVPYVLLRGPASRIWRLTGRRGSPAKAS